MLTANVKARSQHWLAWGKNLLGGVGELVCPPACHLCNAPLASGSEDFCPACKVSLIDAEGLSCPRCGLTVGPYADVEAGCLRCRKHTFHFESALRLAPYDGRLREAVLRIKQWPGEALAEGLGRLWAERVHERLQAFAPDVVVPVPLHWLRRFRRGYNQAETLARVLADRLRLPCRPRWLCRIRHTPHQTGQSFAARQANVRDAFRAAGRPDLPGKTIVLVDDVMTTGNTCSEAARALKKAGARRVIAAVVARAGA